MALTTNTNKSRKSNNNTTVTFSIALNDDETVQFNPTKTFAHVNTEQVLKIITSGELDACEPNQKGYINYKLTGNKKTLGFINFYENGLDVDSDNEEIQITVANLNQDLSSVKLENITLPMTSGEADDMIANL
jgi:hypothetical protein